MVWVNVDIEFLSYVNFLILVGGFVRILRLSFPLFTASLVRYLKHWLEL